MIFRLESSHDYGAMWYPYAWLTREQAVQWVQEHCSSWHFHPRDKRPLALRPSRTRMVLQRTPPADDAPRLATD